MPRSYTANVRTAEVRGEYDLRKASLNNAARLDETELKGAYGLVQTEVKELTRAIADQMELRAKRGSSLQQAAADYVEAMNRGSLNARINALVNLKRTEAANATNVASNVFTPNTTLLNSFMGGIPGYQASSTSWKDSRIAVPAWREFLKNAKSQEDFLSLLPEMERRHGAYTEQGFGVNSQEAQNYQWLLDAGRIKADQVKQTDAANAGFYNRFDTWVANKDYNLNDPQQRSLAIDKFIADQAISDTDLPKPAPGFMSTINKWAANPQQASGTWDSDIRANIADLDARLAKVKKEAPTRAESESPATLNEILGGWLSRPDVRDWAESHGFKLGELVEPDPDTQKLIDQGLYPKELLVNGRIYKSAPDDLAAMRFAYEQMGQDPDKSLEYAKGLAADPAKRKIVEVTVATGPRPKAVSSGRYTDSAGQEHNILKMDDGSFAKLTSDGEASRFLVDDGDPELLWELATQKKELAEAKEVDGIDAPTETKVIYEMGRVYNKDPMGSVRGIDEDGNEVVIKKEDIVRKEYPDGSRFERTDAQRRKAEEAAKARKQTGFYDAEPIGEKLSRGEKKAAEKAKTELIVPQREPNLAERVTRQRLDRQLEEVNRLKALADEARAEVVVVDRIEGDVAVVEYQGKLTEIPVGQLPAGTKEGSIVRGNPQKAARLESRYAKAKAEADRTRSEVDEMVRERSPGIPILSEGGYDEQLRPKVTGEAFQKEYTPRESGELGGRTTGVPKPLPTARSEAQRLRAEAATLPDSDPQRAAMLSTAATLESSADKIDAKIDAASNEAREAFDSREAQAKAARVEAERAGPYVSPTTGTATSRPITVPVLTQAPGSLPGQNIQIAEGAGPGGRDIPYAYVKAGDIQKPPTAPDTTVDVKPSSKLAEEDAKRWIEARGIPEIKEEATPPAATPPQREAFDFARTAGLFSPDAAEAMALLNAPSAPVPTTKVLPPVSTAPSRLPPASALPKQPEVATAPSPIAPQKRPVATPPSIGTKQAGGVPLAGFDWGSAPPSPPAKPTPVGRGGYMKPGTVVPPVSPDLGGAPAPAPAPTPAKTVSPVGEGAKKFNELFGEGASLDSAMSAGSTISTPITPTASTSPQKKAFSGARKKPTDKEIEDFEFSPNAGVMSVDPAQ